MTTVDTDHAGKVAETKHGKFGPGDLILAKSGPLLYQARIIKAKIVKNETHFFVHYTMWNKNWDSWVSENDVYENNEKNNALAEDLKRKLKEAKSHKSRRGRPAAEDTENEKEKNEDAASEEPKAKKPKKEQNGDPTIEDDSEPKTHKITLRIPGQIKKELIVDWENVTKHRKLLELPRKGGSVAQILTDFLKTKSKNADSLGVFTEMCNGIQMYFNRALPFLLLYTLERQQFKELSTTLPKEVVPSEFYGAEHLSRLFVKLPELLSQTQMDTSELGALQTKLVEFLKWFAKNPKYFGKQSFVSEAARSSASQE